MTDDELPDGWALATLGEIVADMQTGFACGKHSREDGIPHLRPMNVSEDGLIVLDDLKLVPAAEVDKDERWLRNGDVLFNNTNSPALVGKTAYYGFQEQRAYSNHMTRLRVGGAVIPLYLAHFLHRLWRESYFEEVCNNHVSQASIGRTVLAEVPIALPPLAEQERIVAAVERLLAAVSAARARLDRVPATLKRFRQAVLAAACAGRLTADWRGTTVASAHDSDTELPAGWSMSPVSNLASIQNGRPFPSKQYCGSGIRLLRPGNLHKSGDVSWTHENTMCLPEHWENECRDFVLGSGELVMNLTAQSLKDEFLGRVCLKSDSSPALLNQRICRFIPRAEVDPRPYLYVYFKSPAFRKYVDTLDTGSLIRHMHSRQVISHELPLPPLAEQREIVRRVSALFARADAIDAAVTAARGRVDALAQAVLAKAFRGELVPTEADLARRDDRPYEPAADLLARLRTPAAVTVPPKRTRTAKSTPAP